MANLHELLKEMSDKGASDLHITTGIPPMIRLHGHVMPVGTNPLSPAETKSMAYSILTEAQKQKFEEQWELDLSFGVKGLSRFRANVFMQRGAVAVDLEVHADAAQAGVVPVHSETAAGRQRGGAGGAGRDRREEREKRRRCDLLAQWTRNFSCPFP